MYVATNRINISKGNGADLETRFGPRGGVELEPGFKSFELWKLNFEAEHEADHEEYLVVTHWESENAFKQWIGSESFREAHANMRIDYIIGHGEVANYDVRLSSKPLSS